MLKHPLFGYGKNMNPCIDCRIFMLREAKKFMKDIEAKFIITGEVLGERPMTQNRKSMLLIERESELVGKITRPLSAKLLMPSAAEEQGLIDRKKLFSIEGRRRKDQMALAEQMNIRNYPTPAGGCLLTDAGFSRKLRDALNHTLH